MLPDRVSNPGPLTYESGALPIALRRPACTLRPTTKSKTDFYTFFMILNMYIYIAPGQKSDSSQGTKF